MNKIKNRFAVICMLLCLQFSYAQDSLKLSHQEFLNIVKNYHPLAFKYQLQNQIAKAEITQARGNFDPVIAGKLGEKNIDGTNYYRRQVSIIALREASILSPVLRSITASAPASMAAASFSSSGCGSG